MNILNRNLSFLNTTYNCMQFFWEISALLFMLIFVDSKKQFDYPNNTMRK
jgi:hypothetical protein